MSKKAKTIFKRVGVALLILMLVFPFIPVSVAKSAILGNGDITINKFGTRPTYDGVITTAEWGEKIFTVADGEPFTTMWDHEGNLPRPLTADVYLGYDSGHFYLGVVAKYEGHVNEALLPEDVWKGDCIQIQIASEPGGTRNEMGFALSSLSDKNLGVSWEFGALFNLEGDGKDFIVTRDDSTNTTVYEIGIPASAVPNLDSFADGAKIPFSIVFPMSGGGFWEFMDGISHNKDINMAAIVTLGSAGGSAGSTIDANGDIALGKFSSAPILDGSISAAEWGEKVFTVADGAPFITMWDHEGNLPRPLTADVYLGYDNDHFYLGVVAKYEGHVNEALLPEDVWKGDCIQIQIASEPGGTRNEMGFALSSLSDKNLGVSWEFGALFNLEGDGKDFIVTRDDSTNTTIYEIAIPASAVPNLASFTDGAKIPFSIVFPMSGGGFWEFKDGISHNKDINMASIMTLGGGGSATGSTMDANGNIKSAKFATAPVYDGNITEAEWGKKVFTVADGAPFITMWDHEGNLPRPLTADVYLGYDNDHFYLGIIAEYEGHANEALLPEDVWKGDCIQIQIASDPGGTRNEMGFALSSLNDKNLGVSWEFGALFNLEGEGKDYIVTRDGNTTVYEIGIPASAVPGLDSFADGKVIPFSIVFPMSGGGFWEFKDGISHNKDINMAALVGLGVEPGGAAPSGGESALLDDGNLTIARLGSVPSLDGQVSEAEWGSKAFTVANGLPFIITHNGAEGSPFTADIYLGYDNDKLYMAAVADYPNHKQEALLPGDIWAGDCLQVQLASAPGGERYELGFALNSATGANQANKWAGTNDFTMQGDGTDYIVTRDGSKTVYEIAIPASLLGLGAFEDGQTIAFSFAFPISDGTSGGNPGGFIEFRDALVGPKDINLSALAGLGVAPEAPPRSQKPNVSTQLADQQATRGNRTVPGIIEAEDYNELYGPQPPKAEDCGDEGGSQNIGFTSAGDLLVFNDVDFTSAPRMFYVRMAGGNAPANKSIKLYIDSLDNPVAADVVVENFGKDGGWQAYETYSADITESITGKHTVYIVIDGGANYNWFGFDAVKETEPVATEAPEATATTAPTSTPVPTPEPVVTPAPEEKGGSNAWIWIIVAVVVVGGVGGFIVVKNKKGKK